MDRRCTVERRRNHWLRQQPPARHALRDFDDDSRRQFSRYWWLIGRFSALIRRIVLDQIKRDAESAKVD